MKRFILLTAVMASLLSCAMNANLVRSRYSEHKISQLATISSLEKFWDSGFRSYLSYKTTSRSDFDMHYFTSLDYSYSTSYQYIITQTRYLVNSSRILPRENLVTMGNLFSDAILTKDGKAILRFYLIEDEKLISRKYCLELSFPSTLLEGQDQRKTVGALDGVTLTLKNRHDVVLYYLDREDAIGFAELETSVATDGVLAGKLSASLKSSTDDSRYNVKEGEFWIRL